MKEALAHVHGGLFHARWCRSAACGSQGEGVPLLVGPLAPKPKASPVVRSAAACPLRVLGPGKPTALVRVGDLHSRAIHHDVCSHTSEEASVHRTNIYLDEEQLRALKHLAAEQRCSVAELVRRAINQYVATQLVDETAWRERLDDFLARVRSRMPTDVPAEEIEADVTAAREEVLRT
jgi:hypothetical protein